MKFDTDRQQIILSPHEASLINGRDCAGPGVHKYWDTDGFLTLASFAAGAIDRARHDSSVTSGDVKILRDVLRLIGEKLPTDILADETEIFIDSSLRPMLDS